MLMNMFERFDKLEEADRVWHELQTIEEEIKKCKDNREAYANLLAQKESKKKELDEYLKYRWD